MNENGPNGLMSDELDEQIKFEDSMSKAKLLLEKYADEILNEEYFDDKSSEDVDIGPNQAISKYLSQCSDEDREQYWGHGITRGSEDEQIAAAMNIASNKVIKGWTSRVGGRYGGAWTSGSFLVLSPRGEGLMKLENGESITHKDLSWDANIGAIVVNNKYYPIFQELKNMFPDVNIIKANELPQYIQSSSARKIQGDGSLLI